MQRALSGASATQALFDGDRDDLAARGTELAAGDLLDDDDRVRALGERSGNA